MEVFRKLGHSAEKRHLCDILDFVRLYKAFKVPLTSSQTQEKSLVSKNTL